MPENSHSNPGGRSDDRARAESAGSGTVLRLASRASALSFLADGFAHELRGPLNALVLDLELIAQTATGKDASGKGVEERIQGMRQSVRRLDALIGRFTGALDLSRDRERCDIAAVTAEVIDVVGPRLRRQGVAVEIDTGDASRPLDGHGLLWHALLNLAINATEALERGGTLAVRVARAVSGDEGRSGATTVTITDDGGGIDPAVLPRIWEPGFTTREGHAGLGLPVARELLRELGGAVAIAPERGGARATVTL